MGAQIRLLRRRIKTVRSMKKITKAMELVATSRLGKAQERVQASRANIDHPLLRPRENVRRAGVLVISSDRGLCGAYNANVIRTAEELISRRREDGKQPVLYVVGRKALSYYRFRDRPVEQSWIGFSEKPTFDDAREVASSLIEAFEKGADDADEHGGDDGVFGVDELHVVYTTFKSLMTQSPHARFLAPMEIEEAEYEEEGLLPAYEFEPEAAELLAAAASESAARRRAMKAATDNAEDVARTLTRQMNSARQAEITQEISEIVGGANALAAAGSEV